MSLPILTSYDTTALDYDPSLLFAHKKLDVDVSAPEPLAISTKREATSTFYLPALLQLRALFEKFLKKSGFRTWLTGEAIALELTADGGRLKIKI